MLGWGGEVRGYFGYRRITYSHPRTSVKILSLLRNKTHAISHQILWKESSQHQKSKWCSEEVHLIQSEFNNIIRIFSDPYKVKVFPMTVRVRMDRGPECNRVTTAPVNDDKQLFTESGRGTDTRREESERRSLGVWQCSKMDILQGRSRESNKSGQWFLRAHKCGLRKLGGQSAMCSANWSRVQ